MAGAGETPVATLRRSMAVALLVPALLVGDARADDVEVMPVPSREHASLPRSGGIGLVYRGGLDLRSSDDDFGGFSDLIVDTGGNRLVAISDKGRSFTATLIYRDGRLVDLVAPDLKRLRDEEGGKLKKRRRDAEGLASDGAGGFIVAFEREGRLWHYPAARKPFMTRPREIALPPDALALRRNRGIEAIARLCDGRLLAIAQEPADTETAANVWVLDGDRWHDNFYPVPDGFAPTGTAALPDCSVLVLLRSMADDGRHETRIDVLPSGSFDGGALPAPTATLGIPRDLDGAKFEGLATYATAEGEVLVYLMSDNDFEDAPTRLLMFALTKLSEKSGSARTAR